MISRPWPDATRILDFATRLSGPADSSLDRRAATWKPTLWRVSPYSRPGFPKPAISQSVAGAANSPS